MDEGVNRKSSWWRRGEREEWKGFFFTARKVDEENVRFFWTFYTCTSDRDNHLNRDYLYIFLKKENDTPLLYGEGKKWGWKKLGRSRILVDPTRMVKEA